MLMLLAITIAVASAVFIGRLLAERFAADHIQQLMDRHRESSHFVSRGELIDGSRHVPVALALGTSALYYENLDLQASLDLEWIGEVDYAEDVVSGRYVGEGKILTIRCYSHSLRFLVPMAALPQWQVFLPAHGHAACKNAPAVDVPFVPNRELSRADDDGWPTHTAVAEGAAS